MTLLFISIMVGGSMIDFFIGVLLIILGVLLKDYVINILPWQLKAITKRRLLNISSKVNAQERKELIEIRKEVFKGFLIDCKCEDSLIMKYTMIISFALSPINDGNSTPRKIKNKNK